MKLMMMMFLVISTLCLLVSNCQAIRFLMRTKPGHHVVEVEPQEVRDCGNDEHHSLSAPSMSTSFKASSPSSSSSLLPGGMSMRSQRRSGDDRVVERQQRRTQRQHRFSWIYEDYYGPRRHIPRHH